jgi:SynChlorMet cassette radical SAM/SPASM protein ScmE
MLQQSQNIKLMATPRCLDIAITNKCNLRCRYCYHFESAGDVDTDLSLDEWLAFFEELQRCNVLEVVLSGGEPFFRDDLKDILQGIVANRMRFSILSNGSLITEELAAFIAQTKRCNRVQVSVDGSNPQTHDCFRGKGAFDRAIQGVKILQQYGLPVAVRVTIHRENVNDLNAIAAMLLDELALPAFSTNSTYLMGLCKQYSERVQLTLEEQTVAMETLLQLEKKYGSRVSATAGPLFNAKQWLEMEEAKRQGKAALPGRGFVSGCNGVRRKLAIRSDGIVAPCSQLSHIELGKINQDPLADLWRNHPELNRLRNAVKIPLDSFEYCQGCEYVNFCAGSCPGVSYVTTGLEEHPYPDSCLKRFLEKGGRLPQHG